MNIYVGNLSYDTSEDDLRSAFEAYGEVDSAKIITDRDTGRSKGFGFVEMPDQGNGAGQVLIDMGVGRLFAIMPQHRSQSFQARPVFG